MKKQSVKKLRIGKETLLPLDSRTMRGVEGGIVDPVDATKATDFLHVDGAHSTLYVHYAGA